MRFNRISMILVDFWTIHKERRILCSLCNVSLLSVKTWMEGIYDGVFGKMQIISNSFKILKHI